MLRRYTQLAVALLCALNNGMSTTTLIALCRRVGETCLQFWCGKQREFRFKASHTGSKRSIALGNVGRVAHQQIPLTLGSQYLQPIALK